MARCAGLLRIGRLPADAVCCALHSRAGDHAPAGSLPLAILPPVVLEVPHICAACVQEDASKRPTVRQRPAKGEEKGKSAKRRRDGPLTGATQAPGLATALLVHFGCRRRRRACCSYCRGPPSCCLVHYASSRARRACACLCYVTATPRIFQHSGEIVGGGRGRRGRIPEDHGQRRKM